jgi:hypothetical protein
MLLFAAHDPGAKNQIRPVYDKALKFGEHAEFIDLSSRVELMEDRPARAFVKSLDIRLLFCGSSLNQGEWALIRACKDLRLPTVMMVDISGEQKVDCIDATEFPDRFLVTNRDCIAELSSYGAHPDSIVLGGSVFLEQLALGGLPTDGKSVAQHYGFSSEKNIVAFYTGPSTTQAVSSLVSLASLLPKTRLDDPVIIVRPHPRAENKEQLEVACHQFDFVRYDCDGELKTLDLLAASRFSLSMASTVSLESLVLGIPSAFYQAGWDYAGLDRLYRNIRAIDRIRNRTQLIQFVDAVLENRKAVSADEIEYNIGAMERCWKVVRELRICN